MDSKDRRARNLVAISFAALIYILAGADFTRETFIFGGGVRLESPGVLEQAGVVIYLYALFHFLRAHGPGSIRNMATCVRKHLHADAFLLNHIRKRFQKELRRRISASSKSDERPAEYLDWVSGQHVTEQAMVATFPEAHLPPRNQSDPPWPNALFFESWRLMARAGAMNERKGDGIGGLKTPINPLPVLVASVRAASKAIFRHDEFWEKIFPPVFALGVGELILLEWWFVS